MATTVKRGYRYPGQGVEPDVAADIQKLAEDVAADVDALDQENDARNATVETALALTNGATVFASTDASSTPMLTKSGKVVELSGRVLRSAGTGTVVGIIPAGLRPPRDRFWGETSINASSTDGPRFHVQVKASTGEIILNYLTNSPAWNTQTWIPVRGSWLVP